MMNDSWHPSHPFTQRVSTLLLKMQTGRVRLEIVAVSVMHQNPANDRDETPWQVAFLTRISSALVSIPRRSEMGVGTGLGKGCCSSATNGWTDGSMVVICEQRNVANLTTEETTHRPRPRDRNSEARKVCPIYFLDRFFNLVF